MNLRKLAWIFALAVAIGFVLGGLAAFVFVARSFIQVYAAGACVLLGLALTWLVVVLTEGEVLDCWR